MVAIDPLRFRLAAERDTIHAELRTEAVNRVAGLIIVGAVLLLAYASFIDQRETWAFLGLSMGICGYLSYRIAARHARIGGGIQFFGIGATVIVLMRLHPTPSMVSLFAPVIIGAGIALGWRYALVVAVTASGYTLLLIGRVPGLTLAEIVLPLEVVWLNAVICWLTLNPLYHLLDWSWMSYLEAHEANEDIRDQQGQLAKALKSLDSAYYTLARVNDQLAQAQRVAQDAWRAKSDFAATISHELRAPLNVVLGLTEMMILNPESYDGEILPPTYRGDIEAVYRNALHVLGLVDDVLDLAKIEAHQMPLHRESISISQVIEEAVASVTSLFHDKNLDLAVEVPPGIPLLWADPTRIRQILVNLLNNAVRSTNDGGVRVTATFVDREVVVSIIDTGVGIKPEEIATIFEQYCQVGSALMRKTGSGLGLAISRRLVEKHGGSIWVESEPGFGSTFRFSLPLSKNVITLPWRPGVEWPKSAATSDRRTVAIVGQKSDAARVFRRHLDGYNVVDVSESWVTALAGILPDAWIIGDESAHMDTALVEATLNGAPRIICSIDTWPNVVRDLGVADYLVKPVTAAHLRGAIDRLPESSSESRIDDILVVDDNPEIVRLLTRMMRSRFPRSSIRSAYSGAQALCLIRESRPDLILLDLIMPEVDGCEVLRVIRADVSTRDVPVIVVSAKEQAEETMTPSVIQISRQGGLTVGEALRCVKGALDVLLGAPPHTTSAMWPGADDWSQA
jgi:signal transduction histidine kinase/CheY-like chemotaxis protein